jgi:hypothetical protein
MQDTDGPAHVEALAEPPDPRRVRIDANAMLEVRGEERIDRVVRDLGHRWRIEDDAPVWSPELQRAVGVADDLIAVFVDAPMVAPAEQREIRQRRRPPGRPVMDVMALTESHPTAREAAPVVTMLERAP